MDCTLDLIEVPSNLTLFRRKRKPDTDARAD